HQARNRCRIQQREPRNLGRVQYALFKQVAVLTGRRVVAISTLAGLHLVQDNRSVLAGILNDIPQRLFDRARQNADASRLILIGTLQLIKRLERSNERNTPARYHAFLDGCSGCVQGVFHACLLFLHLDFSGGTDLDQRDSAGELRNTLLKLLLVVIATCVLNLLADGLDAGRDIRSLAASVYDGRVLLRYHNLLGLAQIVQGDLLERESQLIGNHGTAGQGRNVLQHRLAPITEAWSLHRCHLENAPDIIDDQRREGLSFEVLSDHH